MDNDMADRQIYRMATFIETEGDKKVKEVYQQIEEEFQMEKKRLVEKGRSKLDDEYDKKYKHLERQMKIETSAIKTQGRMDVMKAKEETVEKILDEVKIRLANVTDDAKYHVILGKLILQGLLLLLESNVCIRCKVDDVCLISGIISDVTTDYELMTGDTVSLQIDNVEYLLPDVAGGIELRSLDEKFRLDNTFNARLKVMTNEVIPEIRPILFGVNSNRKFND